MTFCKRVIQCTTPYYLDLTHLHKLQLKVNKRKCMQVWMLSVLAWSVEAAVTCHLSLVACAAKDLNHLSCWWLSGGSHVSSSSSSKRYCFQPSQRLMLLCRRMETHFLPFIFTTKPHYTVLYALISSLVSWTQSLFMSFLHQLDAVTFCDVFAV